MPRRRGGFYISGSAPGAAFGPIKCRGRSPDQGHSPAMIELMLAGHSHRLTSGGKAESQTSHYFEAKAVKGVRDEPRMNADSRG